MLFVRQKYDNTKGLFAITGRRQLRVRLVALSSRSHIFIGDICCDESLDQFQEVFARRFHVLEPLLLLGNFALPFVSDVGIAHFSPRVHLGSRILHTTRSTAGRKLPP
jgi:hypothetical protein